MSSRSPRPNPVPVPSVAAELALVSGADQRLVARIRAGDVSAFETLFAAHYESVWTLALAYVKTPEVAEEIAQDVFAWVWENRERLAVREDLSRYLVGAARHHALNHERHRRVTDRWTAVAATDLGTAGVGQGPPATDASVRAQLLAEAIERAIQQLPDRPQQAYRLRMQYHLSNAETAARLGISIKGVEKHVTTALKMLRERFGSGDR